MEWKHDTENGLFQSPRNRVIVPNITEAATASPQKGKVFQSPRNRVIVPNVHCVAYSPSALSSFNPLEIGS